MKQFSIPEQWKEQWAKPLNFFYEYVPTRFSASPREWKIRKLLWQFKQGKYTEFVSNLLANKMKDDFAKYGENLSEYIFACIPASTEKRNTERYENFSNAVCKICHCDNAFPHIHIEMDRLAVHEDKQHKTIIPTNTIAFDTEYFKGKKVILFDDVITQGHTYAQFATALEKIGAKVISAYFLAKTILKYE